MRDIYKGEKCVTWEDGGFIFISSTLSGITISMPKDEFLEFVDELIKAKAILLQEA